MIALFIIASVVFVVVVVVVFTFIVVACIVSTVDCLVKAHFLPPFVQVNAVSSICWAKESGHAIWETTHCV